MEYPFLPQFIIQEMNNNPEFVAKFFKDVKRPDPSKLLKQIETEIELGIIKPMSPKQLLLDIFSMTAFPFAAQTLVKGIINISNDEFFELMEERKIHISKQIINAIKK